jgi:hypothetical protein
MATLNPTPPFGKKIAGFAETIGREKDERIARESLRDLILFNNALEMEMKNMLAAAQKGAALDDDMMGKMTSVKDKYNYAMSGLTAFDDETERCAFLALADAIQDLMAYLHLKRRH